MPIYGVPTPTDERDVGRYGWRFRRPRRIRLGAPGADGDNVNLEGDPRVPGGPRGPRGPGDRGGPGVHLHEEPDIHNGNSDDFIDGQIVRHVD